MRRSRFTNTKNAWFLEEADSRASMQRTCRRSSGKTRPNVRFSRAARS